MVKYDVDELKRQRLIHGLSITALAKLAGLQYGTIVNLEERETEPRPETMKKLATVLGVEMETLVTKTGGF